MIPAVVVATALAVVPMPARLTGTPTGIDLTGTWARLQVTTSLSTVPLLGEVESKTTGIVLLRVSRSGTDEFALEERICGVKNETVGGLVKTTFPRGFLRALSGQRKRARLVRTADGSVRYEELYDVRVGGAHLQNPRTEALPEKPEDPRIVDADGDGRPGLTLHVEGIVGGEVYIVQRDASELSGAVVSNNRISGRVLWASEQRVLGASRAILRANPEARPHPDDRANRFRMRRVPSRATCAEVRARAPRLFGG